MIVLKYVDHKVMLHDNHNDYRLFKANIIALYNFYEVSFTII